MKVKIFYQDFMKNAGKLGAILKAEDGIIFDHDEAVYINTVTAEAEKREEVVDEIFRIFNHLDVDDISPTLKERFKKVGHTSMSIGDYVVFEEDDEVWICYSVGWKIRECKYCGSTKCLYSCDESKAGGFQENEGSGETWIEKKKKH